MQSQSDDDLPTPDELLPPPRELCAPRPMSKSKRKRLRQKANKKRKKERQRRLEAQQQAEKDALEMKLKTKIDAKRRQRTGETMRDARSKMSRAGIDACSMQQLRSNLSKFGMSEAALGKGMTAAQREQMLEKVAKIDPAQLSMALQALNPGKPE